MYAESHRMRGTHDLCTLGVAEVRIWVREEIMMSQILELAGLDASRLLIVGGEATAVAIAENLGVVHGWRRPDE